MHEYRTQERTSGAEVAYWEAEDRRHECAEWLEQRAQALADEAETDEEEG